MRRTPSVGELSIVITIMLMLEWSTLELQV